jgi:hypothetical protein
VVVNTIDEVEVFLKRGCTEYERAARAMTAVDQIRLVLARVDRFEPYRRDAVIEDRCRLNEIRKIVSEVDDPGPVFAGQPDVEE